MSRDSRQAIRYRQTAELTLDQILLPNDARALVEQASCPSLLHARGHVPLDEIDTCATSVCAVVAAVCTACADRYAVTWFVNHWVSTSPLYTSDGTVGGVLDGNAHANALSIVVKYACDGASKVKVRETATNVSYLTPANSSSSSKMIGPGYRRCARQPLITSPCHSVNGALALHPDSGRGELS
jgi:hypothetical protein